MNSDHMVLIWLVVLVVLLLIEVLTLNLTTIWFAGGAVIALISTYFKAEFPVQVVLFLATSLLVLFLLRPSVVKRYNSKLVQTNSRSLIGQYAKVSETVNNDEAKGVAIVNGQEWTARAKEDDMIIEVGSKAEIVDIQGVKLILSYKKEETK